MPSIKIYTKSFCPYCVKAKELIKSLGYEFEEFNLDNNPEMLNELVKKTDWMTVPQIFINDKFIGGFDDLNKIVSENKFNSYLESTTISRVFH